MVVPDVGIRKSPHAVGVPVRCVAGATGIPPDLAEMGGAQGSERNAPDRRSHVRHRLRRWLLPMARHERSALIPPTGDAGATVRARLRSASAPIRRVRGHRAPPRCVGGGWCYRAIRDSRVLGRDGIPVGHLGSVPATCARSCSTPARDNRSRPRPWLSAHRSPRSVCGTTAAAPERNGSTNARADFRDGRVASATS